MNRAQIQVLVWTISPFLRRWNTIRDWKAGTVLSYWRHLWLWNEDRVLVIHHTFRLKTERRVPTLIEGPSGEILPIFIRVRTMWRRILVIGISQVLIRVALDGRIGSRKPHVSRVSLLPSSQLSSKLPKCEIGAYTTPTVNHCHFMAHKWTSTGWMLR